MAEPAKNRPLGEVLIESWEVIVFLLLMVTLIVFSFVDSAKYPVVSKLNSAGYFSGFGLLGFSLYKLSFKFNSQTVKQENKIDSFKAEILSAINTIEERICVGNIHIVEQCNKRKFYINLQSAIARARDSVELTNLDEHEPSHYGVEGMHQHFSSMSELIRSRPNVNFRRICTAIKPDKILWLINSVAETQKCGNFSVRLVKIDQSPVSMISLQIIDNTETLIVDPKTGTMEIARQEHLLWVRGNSMAKSLLQNYEENWKRAIPIKDGTSISKNRLEELVTHYEQSDKSKATMVKKMKSALAKIS